MNNDLRMALFYFLIAILFAAAHLIGTLNNIWPWVAALIFLGLGIYHLVRLRKN